VGSEAVQILTVHQAKGLEFPVTILWDGMMSWEGPVAGGAFRTEREGGGWMMQLQNLTWEEPPGLDLIATEKRYNITERQRVAYVAVSRARDLLVLPRPAVANENNICARLLQDAEPLLVLELEPYVHDEGVRWASGVARTTEASLRSLTDLQGDITTRWKTACATSAAPLLSPASVTGHRHRVVALADVDSESREEHELPHPPRASRFGNVFGETVHRAIGAALTVPGLAPTEAVRRIAPLTGLVEHHHEAVRDVERTVEVLRRLGLLRAPGSTFRLEYPVSGAAPGGNLLSGYIDLLIAEDGGIKLLDFKTDTPPSGSVEATYPEYVRQVQSYAWLLQEAGGVAGQPIRCGLLFTATGKIHWVPRAG